MAADSITDSAGLHERLRALKLERKSYEDAIALDLAHLNEITKNPAPYIKETLSDLAADKDVKKDLIKTGLHVAADYLVDKYVYKKADTFLLGLIETLKEKVATENGGTLIDKILNLFPEKK